MSVTVEIPGGTATLCDDPSELTPRRKRPVEILQTRLGRRVEMVARASALVVDGDVVEERDTTTLGKDGKPVFTGPPFDMTEKDLELFQRLNDALAWSLLLSWTLPIPLPASPDAMLDIPGDVFDALRVETAKIYVDLTQADAQFTVAAVEDLASPTGASDA